MASTEEVLKALQNAKITTLAATEPEELVIDAESRTITVPSSERLFGVTGDMNIERKYFRCPKIVGDNVDLSTHQIFIAYVYTETESGSIFPSIGVAPYHCEDVEVDGEDITFSWKLTGNVFKNPGFILFKMYAKRTEADPNTVFNTTPAIGTVLATIPDGTEEIVEEHPDVIAQIFDRLDALESGGGGTGGTTNYENLSNKPQLNGVTLEGNKTLDQVGVLSKNQGSNNSGKFLSVGSDGNVVPADAPSGGTVDPEQIKQAVNGYLEENPVSGMTAEQEQQLNQNTTDVADLKIALEQKINKSGWTPDKYLGTDSDGNVIVKNAPDDSGGSTETSSQNLIDPSQYTNSGYAGDLFAQFGGNIDVFNTEIDTSENKTFYYRVYRNNQVYDHKVGLRVGCYDSSGDWLYTMVDNSGDYMENFESYTREDGTNDEPLETVEGSKVVVKIIGILTIPSEVSKIKIGNQQAYNSFRVFYPAFAISDEKITNFGSITNEDYSLIQGTSDSEEGVASNKPLLNKLLGMMGDSLTNWGGGNDTQDGFLKIIHDRTGISTVNLGLAGATWEEADGQTQPGVTRVDTYVSGAVRYDCIAFLLGTNVANQGEVTDTSDTKTTMCGAIKYCLEQLITLSPTTPIIVFLPPQRAEGNTEQKARNDIIKQICEIYGVYTFDLYTRSQVIPNTIVAENGTLSDGLHLSEKGQQNFGRIMSTAILDVMGY